LSVPDARRWFSLFLAGFISWVSIGCTSARRGTEAVGSCVLPTSGKEQIRYSCDDLYTRGALEDMCGGQQQETAQSISAVTDFSAVVRHDVKMARHVHPAVALNAVTLVVGYFVFFFRVETDVISSVAVKWRDGEEESFTVTRHGRYFHPGYLPKPPDPAIRRILFYEDVRASELRLAGVEIARQLLQRYAAQRGNGEPK
jgi:hypothetical protein